MYSRKRFFARITEKKIETPCIDFIYPQVEDIYPSFDEKVKNKLNQMIEKVVFNQIPQDITDVDGCSVKVTGRYEITFNDKGILSLTIEVFLIPFKAANGTTVLKALTVNLSNAKQYEFHDLFKAGTDYRLIIKNFVKEQIEEKDIPTFDEVPPITDNQEFYLTDKDLVVFFQELVFTPHFVGPPQFPVPYQLLVNVIDPEGPIAKIRDSC